jgi:hypothetical protein
MRTIETKVYTFDELSDDAKEKARLWWQENCLMYDWWEFVYMDAETIGLRIKEFDIDRNRHAKGDFILSANKVAEKIFEEHGKDCETYKTALNFIDDCKLIELQAELEGKDGDEDYWFSNEIDEAEEEFLKSLLEDYSIMLQNEYEYLTSDESADERIIANEYEFTEDGNRI